MHTEVEERRQSLLEKVGDGLPDQDYQRHVGRIKECRVQLETITKFLKQGVDELENQEERRDRESNDRAARRRHQ